MACELTDWRARDPITKVDATTRARSRRSTQLWFLTA